MKDFQEFRDSITQETLDEWSEEIYNELAPKFEDMRENDPDKYFSAYPQSFSLKVSMRMLEAYHSWLHQ